MKEKRKNNYIYLKQYTLINKSKYPLESGSDIGVYLGTQVKKF